MQEKIGHSMKIEHLIQILKILLDLFIAHFLFGSFISRLFTYEHGNQAVETGLPLLAF